MVSRREFLGLTAGAGAALVLPPQLLRALPQSQGQLIQRAIPSTGEMLPVIGLSRGNVPADHAALRQVFQALVDNGGRIVDTVHGWDSADQVAGTIASELGIQDRIFWSAQLRPAPVAPGSNDDPAAVATAQVEALFARLRVPRIDLIQVSVMRPDLATTLAVLRELKRQGRLRYIGVTAAFPNQHATVESVMRSEPIDFISVDYAIDNRAVEATILPLALQRRIGVLAYFPFGGNASREDGTVTVVNRLFQRAGTRPLPEWAAEFDATSWAQFFLKYIVSHPAVTAVRVGTTKASHMVDNIGGGMGRLPNEAMRKRMAEFVDSLPELPLPQQGVVLPAAVLDRYVGEYRSAAGLILTVRRDGDRLFVKRDTNPEVPLSAQSETRFAFGRAWSIEFGPPDAAGTVTDLIIHQGNQRTPATRSR